MFLGMGLAFITNLISVPIIKATAQNDQTQRYLPKTPEEVLCKGDEFLKTKNTVFIYSSRDSICTNKYRKCVDELKKEKKVKNKEKKEEITSFEVWFKQNKERLLEIITTTGDHFINHEDMNGYDKEIEEFLFTQPSVTKTFPDEKGLLVVVE